MYRRLGGIIAPAATLLAIGLAWSASVRLSGIPPLLLPGPGDVLAAAIGESATLLAAIWDTLVEILLAALIAVAAGFATAVMISMSAAARRIVFPYILATQVMPKVALAPILIAWFGTGMQSRLILAFLIAYFPMAINTLSGLAGTNEPMLQYAQSLAASKWQVLLKVRLPSALPAIIGGIKITLAVTVIGIVVGEFVASDSGLGQVIINSMASMNTSLTIAATIAIALIGLVLLGLVEMGEHFIVYWRPR